MECRKGCGACCIAISISSSIPGLANGKPAGERCLHLDDNNCCKIFESPLRPKVCEGFSAEELVCGKSFEEAMRILTEWERYCSC